MITYEQIEQANSKLSTVQLGTGNKKKDYVMVPQRVKAFRMLYPQGFILTDILSHENNIVVMQTKVGYYNEDGDAVVLGTGTAFEEKNKGMVNGTSYIENCETSAVGRALGFLALGIDGGGICSAEELVNAITAQNQMQQFNRPQDAANGASVTTTGSVPAPQAKAPETAPVQPETPGAYIKRRIAEFTAKNKDFNFLACRQALIDAKIVEDVPSAIIRMPQAVDLMDAIDKNFFTKAG